MSEEKMDIREKFVLESLKNAEICDIEGFFYELNNLLKKYKVNNIDDVLKEIKKNFYVFVIYKGKKYRKEIHLNVSIKDFIDSNIGEEINNDIGFNLNNFLIILLERKLEMFLNYDIIVDTEYLIENKGCFNYDC